MKKVLIILAQGCEEIEAITVIDLLRRAGIDVLAVGLNAQPVRASRGVMLLPDSTLDAALQQEFDLIVLPGGQPGTRNLAADSRVISLLQRMAAAGKLLAAICAAPSVLAAAGLLDGRRATCYPTCLDDFPQVLRQTSAVEIDGNFITSRGPGTAIEFALTLVEILLGRDSRQHVAAELQS